VLVDIDAERLQRAVSTIELLKATTNDLAIFAIGEMSHPPSIVAAMRAGACEYLERNSDASTLQEALTRYSSTRSRSHTSSDKARVFTFLNAKGGSGATTLAVNISLALQEDHGATVLVDFATLGHAALHLNARPTFGLADALQNLHRMDKSLLEGFMTTCKRDLHLLAGVGQVAALSPTAAELARLFDLLVTHYRYVVVDSSSRFDAATRLIASLSENVLLVACSDVASLWSAARVQQYLGETGSRERVRLVLNRFRKVPGFSEADAESAVGAKVLWRVPNQYFAISSAIDRGTPVMDQRNSEIARCFAGLAQELTRNDVDVKRAAWSLFKSV